MERLIDGERTASLIVVESDRPVDTRWDIVERLIDGERIASLIVVESDRPVDMRWDTNGSGQ